LIGGRWHGWLVNASRSSYLDRLTSFDGRRRSNRIHSFKNNRLNRGWPAGFSIIGILIKRPIGVFLAQSRPISGLLRLRIIIINVNEDIVILRANREYIMSSGIIKI
jgi:hypothetical protein